VTDRQPHAPARIVIRAPNWLGDAVLALPAMTALRRRFPGAHLTVAAVPSVAALFHEETDVVPDAVLEVTGSSRAVVAALSGGRFDLGVLFPNSFRSAWQFWRAGIPSRWGYATSGRGLLLTTRSPRARGAMHQSDYYRTLVAGLGVPAGEAGPRLSPGAASRARAAALLEEARVAPGARLVCLAPGAAYGSAKQWPTDRMAALAARLIRERDATCLILGAGHDREAARAIESWLRSNARDAASRAIDLVGRTSLGALIGVAARSDVFVSNDSGAMHVAAALGRPVVAIFGPTNERATQPIGAAAKIDVITEPVFCRPCMLRDCPIDHRCMKRITVDRVTEAVVRHLDAAAAS
jgi:heptosyltransferase-2